MTSKAKMPLTLVQLTPTAFTNHPSLIRRIANVHLTSFLTNAVYSGIYPGGYSETMITASMGRHTNAIYKDPTTRYLAVVDATIDPSRDEDACSEAEDELKIVLGKGCQNVIAFSKFNVFNTGADQEGRKDTDERDWPAEMNKLLVDDFWGQILTLRGLWGPRLGAHVQVDIVATSPAHMRRGAAGLLMKSIGAEADSLGLAGFLEGSPEGAPVYERAGFMDVGDRVKVDLGRYIGKVDRGETWREREGVREGEEKGGKAEGWYENVVMLRPPNAMDLEEFLAGLPRKGTEEVR